ncbi:MAG: Maf family nucleotide pyrophosphatase [Rhodospirillales bacterium]|jgi:septum formation protein|nr:Maf family nucleotide pyrophosphatase [Rhodospirillales bacterium]
MNNQNGEIILASASKARAQLLENAGLTFSAKPAPVDEAAIKSADDAKDLPVGELASRLARAKALEISKSEPQALVIGADQILELNGRNFDKPEDQAEARDHLTQLQGKTHKLVNTICVIRDQELLWHYTNEAKLTMRRFDNGLIDAYLAEMGPRALSSVGAYQLEGLGAQLFSKVEGDFFSILGLPLLPLLDFLRTEGALKS